MTDDKVLIGYRALNADVSIEIGFRPNLGDVYDVRFGDMSGPYAEDLTSLEAAKEAARLRHGTVHQWVEVWA